EPCDEFTTFGWLAEAGEGAGVEVTFLVVLRDRRFQSAFKDTRGDRVDEDAVGADFVCEAARESFECAFARRVMNGPGDRARASDRRDVYDAAVLLTDHAAHCCATHAKCSEQVQLHDVCEVFV